MVIHWNKFLWAPKEWIRISEWNFRGKKVFLSHSPDNCCVVKKLTSIIRKFEPLLYYMMQIQYSIKFMEYKSEQFQ